MDQVVSGSDIQHPGTMTNASLPDSNSSISSAFENGAFVPPDAIFEVGKNYLADTHPQKINVGAGTYRDEKGLPWVLPSVNIAKQLIEDCGHEYLPIAGLGSFRTAVIDLVFHHTAAQRQKRVSAFHITFQPQP